jgi:hypothetical protein
VSAGHVNGTDDVHLVVLERYVPFVDIDDVIRVIYPESEIHKGHEQLTTQILKAN